ncbi:GNAT family N-acetyltransferase [Paenibacillus cremeus]|uniref:GNAT family N-acetyltransferase n=1 Tax=Paenibacillus cremeus TaxID=2163881 RepID=A0A559K8Y0_9BACL|nr:GNAT family N-acetyltransferase [Paenibacillus cremeus]TVY08582.1 GNAT family N-acetyltransferase [Paenibacillus cremeus]
MSNEITTMELHSIDPAALTPLSELLIHVVEDGASIGFLPPVGHQDAVAYWSGVLQPGVVMWAAVQQGRIVGTVQLHLALKANAVHRAEVAKLMVHPEHRRQGIAQRLMQTLENAAKEQSRSLLVLDTRAGDPSNTLYQSLGYIEAGRIPNYAMSADGSLHETVYYYKQL